jgi:hypothetical protein
MERYMLPLRILVTLLILTMFLPGWGILEASNAYEEQTASTIDAIDSISPFER